MMDNGYLAWSTTIPSMKNEVTYKYIHFSEWLESMRKDIEFAFVILKGRLFILHYGIRIRIIERCDHIKKTWCALHNRLISIDDLQKDWNIGGCTKW